MSDKKPPLAVTLVATALGAGLLPVAPGTWGTIVAVPIAWGLGLAGPIAYALVTLAIIAVGSWAADRYCEATGRHDNQQIVVDEVAGYLVTLWPVAKAPVELALGFVLFRLFDIVKPPPVRQIDRHVKGGFGVVADDLGAGVYAALVLWLLARYGVVAWISARVHLG